MNKILLPQIGFVFSYLAAAYKTQETSKIPAKFFGRFREWIFSKKCSIVCATKEVDNYGKAQCQWGRLRALPVADEASKKEWQQQGVSGSE